ncbi:uncharacterized protein LOC117176358 [Belonocnema kinseyi]|uniref:uncharacterized protein LOC117176358 n=1 Tax=Belonocnema kinseyi TaxID=2817044 RepID=UPI00143E053D|nr:uncharacterized protein LOC117176358 [Belonocnema kinseyi]
MVHTNITPLHKQWPRLCQETERKSLEFLFQPRNKRICYSGKSLNSSSVQVKKLEKKSDIVNETNIFVTADLPLEPSPKNSLSAQIKKLEKKGDPVNERKTLVTADLPLEPSSKSKYH